ncbi:MAG: DUF4188 domain-containing protein [Pseudomonadota bacterium]
MGKVIADRVTARIEGDFVVFLIGARINAWWKIWRFGWFLRAMPRMLRELDGLPAEETGFLGATQLGMATLVQYWRSFDALERYARAPERAHQPAWAEFNRRMKGARGDIGIWHETYLVRAGDYECVYSGMPPHGMGKVGVPAPAKGKREGARGRLSGPG